MISDRPVKMLLLFGLCAVLMGCAQLPASTAEGDAASVAAIPPTEAPPTEIPPTAIPPTAIPPTAIPPTAIPATAVPATAVPATSTAVTVVADWTTVTSRVETDLNAIGNPDATLTITEFSDFM